LRPKGLTLVELLVALMVTAVIMASVATLAYAMGSVNDASDQTSRNQAQVRYATLRIVELLKHCKLICGTPGSDLALWRADDNGDGWINPPELVYIEARSGGSELSLLEFTGAPAWPLKLTDIGNSSFKTFLWVFCGPERTVLVDNCDNIGFYPADVGTTDEFVSVSFDVVEAGGSRNYQVDGFLRGRAGNLLNAAGDELVADDD